MSEQHRSLNQSVIGAGMIFSLLSASAMGTELDKVDNWDVDGAHGTLYVTGALTESACRLAMSSAYQTVNLGTTGTGQLQHEGQTGTPVAVQLRLEDCLSGESRQRNKLGNLLWSPDMPAMKIRFLAPADSQEPRLAAVTGVKGIGLQLSDASRRPITLGQYSAPQLVSPGQNQLTYYVTPVRTSAGLNAGAYQALIQFQVSYD
ncbi:type 1 fimbrial protein [Providencia stuartii]|nr:fimbrial protein [Providencia stuartii]MBG5898601.1 type 1 fimbrial protein [Providencia stuartii]